MNSNALTSSATSSDLCSNIQACAQLAKVLSSTLGPCGMDKLLIDTSSSSSSSASSSLDHMLASNDGATLVRHLSIQHPAALLLTQVSQSQDDQVGDGTTSVLLVCCSLLDRALDLIENRGVHASHVISGYQQCLAIAQRQLHRFAIPVIINDMKTANVKHENEEQRKNLMDIARTTIGSKVINTDANHFVSLVVDCAMNFLNGDEDNDKNDDGDNEINDKSISGSGTSFAPNNVFVHKVIGPSITQSELLDGCIIRKKLPISAPQCIENARILVCKLDSLATARTKFHNAQISVRSLEQVNDINAYERESIFGVCQQIVSSGVNVVFNSGHAIHPLAQSYLFRHNVLCVGHVDYRTAQMIATVTGATIQSQLLTNDLECVVGRADSVKQVILSDEKVIRICGCRHYQTGDTDDDDGDSGASNDETRRATRKKKNKKQWSSILLRAPTVSLLDECERSVHDALCTIKAASRYIGGGGCMYMHIAQYLRSIMMQQPGVIQLVMEAYAQALEIIPATLARNAGLQSSHLVAELRSMHSQFIAHGMELAGETSPFMALDLNRGTVCRNIARELQVKEPVSVLQNVLNKSMDATEAIIRIDRNVYLRPVASATDLVRHQQT